MVPSLLFGALVHIQSPFVNASITKLTAAAQPAGCRSSVIDQPVVDLSGRSAAADAVAEGRSIARTGHWTTTSSATTSTSSATTSTSSDTTGGYVDVNVEVEVDTEDDATTLEATNSVSPLVLPL
jgi:hypothetical protein